MKKTIILFISLFILCSCSKKEEQPLIKEFYPKYNSIEIKPGTIFSNTLVSLGEYNKTRIEPSSYYEGNANIYEYDNFEIETYYDNSLEKIYSITITSEEQLTNEGIKIGDTKDMMIKKYGKDYKNPVDNIYVYNLSNTNISFSIENDIIIQIIYFLS